MRHSWLLNGHVVRSFAVQFPFHVVLICRCRYDLLSRGRGMSACIIDHVRELPLQNPGWLFDLGDYATQLCGDSTKPI